MYIFFSGDLHFFAVLPAKISWGDTYMYKYKYIYIYVCVFVFVCFNFSFSKYYICVPKCLNVSFHLCINIFFYIPWVDFDFR